MRLKENLLATMFGESVGGIAGKIGMIGLAVCTARGLIVSAGVVGADASFALKRNEAQIN